MHNDRLRVENDERFMKLAIEEAEKSRESLRCGVIITQMDKVLAAAYNRQHEVGDATAHAEMMAIRKAGEKLEMKNIFGGMIYCTCEPCAMCLSAIYFAKIERVVYGVDLREVSDSGKRIDIEINEFMKRLPRKIEVVAGFMKEECLNASRR